MIDITQVFDGTLNPTAGAAVTATRVSTNTIDWLVGRDMGAGDILGVHVQILQAFNNLTSLQIGLQVCDTVGGTYLTLLTTPAIPVAQLIIGASVFRYSFPMNQVLNATAGVLKTPGRFVQLAYTVVGTAPTTGTVFSYLTPALDRQEYWTYPSNYTAYASPGEV